ncbi:MAG TPA: LamG domain-containing protein [Candidatus Paceibacterota bacterium]|nr:LamG domain-containing protein [Candidatus Paceibacterota bacterium]
MITRHKLIFIGLAGIFFLPAFAQASVLGRPTNNLGLVSYWPLDEGSGSITDDVTGAHDGTLHGSPAWVAGKFGDAVSFNDNGSQYISAGTNTITGANPFTLAAWVNTAQLTNYAGAVAIGPSASYESAYIGVVAGAQYGTSNSLGGGLYGVNIGSGVTTIGAWVYIAMTSDGTNIRMYINGTLTNTVAATPSLASGPIGIGRIGTDTTYDFKGVVDSPRIYSRALSGAEVSALYRAGQAKFTSLNSNGLTGYWNFNEGSGSTAKDFISGSPNGSVMGSPSWVAGKQGSALLLNGSSQYVDVPITVNYPAFTVSAWFNATSLSASNSRIVANSHTDDAAEHNGFQLMFNTGGTSGFFDVGNGSSEGRATWSQTLSTGTWYHYVGVYDGSSVYAYINGVQVASTSYAGGPIAPSGYDVSIGRNNNAEYTGDYFSGVVDDVRIYDRALSPSEVAAMYTANIPAGKVNVNTSSANLSADNSLGSGLVSLWTFDGADLTSTTAADRSGQGNSGTLTGSPAPTIGKLGQALLFNGSSSYVRRATLATSIGSNATICAWIKTSYTGGDQVIWTIDRNASSIVNEGIFKIIAGKLRYWDYTGSAYGFTDNTPDGNTTVTDGAWHDVCFTKSGTAGTFYVDGLSDGTKTAATNISYGATDMVVGTDYRGSSSYFNGAIDDVRVYGRALSSAEIQQLYLMGK